MKKKNGFTLIELLAMLVILGLLMVVAIPNITGIMTNQRFNTMRQDAQTLIDTAKIKVAKDTTIDKPAVGECLFFSLDSLNDDGDFDSGPNGGVYHKYESFVIYTRETVSGTTTRFKYYVRLIEVKEENGRTNRYGFTLVDEDNLKGLTSKDVESIPATTLLDLSADKTDSASKLRPKFTPTTTPKCTSASIKYYARNHSCKEEEGIYSGLYYNSQGVRVASEAAMSGC